MGLVGFVLVVVVVVEAFFQHGCSICPVGCITKNIGLEIEAKNLKDTSMANYLACTKPIVADIMMRF